jgi:hypothetical protein
MYWHLCVLLVSLLAVVTGLPDPAHADTLRYTYTVVDIPPPAGTRFFGPLQLRALTNRRIFAGVYLGPDAFSARVVRGVVHPILCPPEEFPRHEGFALIGPEIYSMNNAGTVVGNDEGIDGLYGFVQTADGPCRHFQVPGATATLVLGVSDQEVLVGFYTNPLTQEPGLSRIHGFLRDAGGFVTFAGPGPRDVVFPTAINALGDIVGYLYQDVQPDNTYSYQAFLYRRGVYELLDGPHGEDLTLVDINNRGQVLGLIGQVGLTGGRAFLLEDGQLRFVSLPTAATTELTPTALNDLGQFVATEVETVPYAATIRHQVLGSPSRDRDPRQDAPTTHRPHGRRQRLPHWRDVQSMGHAKAFAPCLDDDGQVVLSNGRTVVGRGRR